MFGAKGFHDTTLKEIAELAEFSVGSVYSFFENKDDLFLNVFLRRGGRVPARHGGGRRRSAARRSRQLHALVDYEVGFFREHPHFGRLYLRSATATCPRPEMPESPALIAQLPDGDGRCQADLFAPGQQAGELRDGDPVVLAPPVHRPRRRLPVARPGGGVRRRHRASACRSTTLHEIIDGAFRSLTRPEPESAGTPEQFAVRLLNADSFACNRSIRGMGPTTDGRAITDEAIARLRARIGIPEPHPMPPHYRDPDDRHLPPRGRGLRRRQPAVVRSRLRRRHTLWSEPIAPPPLVGGDTLIGEDEVTEVAAEHSDLMKGDPLRGVHAFYSASAREWWAPLRPGHRVFRRNALVGVLDKPSEFAERAVHEWTAQVFRDDDEHVALRPVPADDPHRAQEGPGTQEVRRGRAGVLHRRRDRRDRDAVRRPRHPAAPSRAGGRTSTRATPSARW